MQSQSHTRTSNTILSFASSLFLLCPAWLLRLPSHRCVRRPHQPHHYTHTHTPSRWSFWGVQVLLHAFTRPPPSQPHSSETKTPHTQRERGSRARAHTHILVSIFIWLSSSYAVALVRVCVCFYTRSLVPRAANGNSRRSVAIAPSITVNISVYLRCVANAFICSINYWIILRVNHHGLSCVEQQLMIATPSISVCEKAKINLILICWIPLN